MARRYPEPACRLHMRDVKAWISSGSLNVLQDEADRSYRNETGGVLIGYWADDRNVVITAMAGPGPDAVHGRYSYEHDHVWEAEQIAVEYGRSGRAHVYLGDWHTHPDASSGRLSGTDRRALRQVLNSSEARLHQTLMLVLFGEPQEWQADLWIAKLGPTSAWRWRPPLLVEPAQLQHFD
jgi:integrative and conjugative element protein (TIGR02256 family)